MQRGYVTAEDVELFAINTGELYETHLKYGLNRAGRERWRSHVSNRVWNQFKRELRGNPLIRTEDLNEAADRLRDYYLTHAAEVNAHVAQHGH
jgi:hypothetical protein